METDRLKQEIEPNEQLAFWVAKDDVIVTQEIILPAGKTQPLFVTLTPPTLPPYDPQDMLGRRIRASIRSRFAQVGLDVQNIGPLVHGSMYRRNTDKPFTIAIPAHNYAQKDIYLPKGAPTFRLFYDGGEQLIGQALEKSNAVQVSGDEGYDWIWIRNKNEEAVGTRLRIRDDRKWIPPYTKEELQLREPIRIDPNGSGEQFNRDQVDTYHSPLPENPENDEPIHWVGQTASNLYLQDAYGILAPIAAPTIDGRGKLHEGGWGFHINSHLTDPYRPKWNIRVEIVSKISNSRPNYIDAYFKRAT